MAGTYIKLRVHLVWSTKGRKPLLDPEWRGRLFAHIDSLVAPHRVRLLCAGGVRDHVHLYLELPASQSLAEIVGTIKSSTCRWIQQTFAHRAGFAWQSGYAAFSVTPHDDNQTLDYIRHQETKHRERDFAGEYLWLLERHGVSYDLRHVLE